MSNTSPCQQQWAFRPDVHPEAVFSEELLLPPAPRPAPVALHVLTPPTCGSAGQQLSAHHSVSANNTGERKRSEIHAGVTSCSSQAYNPSIPQSPPHLAVSDHLLRDAVDVHHALVQSALVLESSELSLVLEPGHLGQQELLPPVPPEPRHPGSVLHSGAPLLQRVGDRAERLHAAVPRFESVLGGQREPASPLTHTRTAVIRVRLPLRSHPGLFHNFVPAQPALIVRPEEVSTEPRVWGKLPDKFEHMDAWVRES